MSYRLISDLGSFQIPLEMLRDVDVREERAVATITGDVGISQAAHIAIRLSAVGSGLPGGPYAVGRGG